MMHRGSFRKLWEKVSVGGEEECWPFNGYIGKNRYGSINVGGKFIKAHRAAYEAKFGQIPAGMIVLHKCNNTSCCNPFHLVAGTISENMRHASASGAFAVGKSGVQGVNFSPARNSWRARGSLGGRQFVLYQGPSKEKAIAARRLWEDKHGISFKINGANQ